MESITENGTESSMDRYSRQNIVRYLLLTFGLAWILQALAVYFQKDYLYVYSALLGVSMFAPLISVFLVSGGLKHRKSGVLWKVRLKKNWKWFLLAMFSPLVLVILGAALYFILFPSQFDAGCSYFTSVADRGLGDVSPWLLIAAAAVQSAVFGGLVNMFFAVGEEAGWRGFLTPALSGRFGRTGGLILSGAIWGMWHWPIIIFAGYEYGTGYWGAPYSGIAVMCLFTAAFGIALTWLYEKSESIWVPALAHGAANACAAIPVFCTDGKITGYLFGPYISGLVAGLPLLILGAVLLFRGTIKSEAFSEASSSDSDL
ncbi:MAG: CPBP family intramembrane metalloprotease [Anaerolineales bacterium]|nr:CPBP family intramembrane metalloprotease [Anaerolineales bacterium]